MSSYQAARRQVEKLVAKYEALDSRQRQGYSEAHTRQDFIEPLFQALGWDAHDSREVSEEEQVSRGRVDYAFRLRGVPCFFLEAKAIPVDLDEARWAVQAITYAYNKGVPWAVLTDFEGLKVFNAEWDEPEVMRCRFLDLTCRDYVGDFDKLWWLSKESFLKNRLAKEAAKVGAARKRVPVGERLYSQFREWRELLFKYLFKYNKDCPLRDIDEAIQRILDRLIFIRTCEDRGIEEPMLLPLLRQWKARATRRDFWDELKETFQHFDAAYNSRLFQPHLCDALECEATPFETILQELYSREGEVVRYDFSAIGVDVLGRVYEQYLGHVARVAQVVAEEEAKRRSLIAHLPGLAPKPELTIELAAKKIKRKERGIYYTPQFVVDYIVEHTLGAFLRDCSKDQAERVRVLDPACGSGSFLITAYERLMGYFAELQQLAVLPQEERLEILTRSIYGVDLDAQAVEIAQLNLLLKALEEPALLPDLSDNIRRGNSLISGGEDELREYFGDDWEEKRPFHWEREFGDIMADGGFDVIISNPPYVRIQTLPKDEVAWFNNHYEAATGNYDIYALFVERALQLLRPGGLFGFILPHRFFKTNYGEGLREFIVKRQNVREILDFDGYMVFEAASINTCVLIVGKEPEDKFKFSQVHFIQPPTTGISAVLQKIEEADQLRDEDATVGMLPQSNLTEEPWIFVFPPEKSLWQKLDSMASRLGDITTRIFQGLKTGGDTVYSLEVVREGEQTARVLCSRDGQEYDIERAILKPLIKGGEMKRYHIEETSRRVLFPYQEGKLIPADQFQRGYPKAWAYLSEHKEYLENRERGKMRGPDWYAYTRSQALNTMWRPKILTPEYYVHASYCFDKQGEYYFFGGGAGGYGTVLKSGIEPRYVLGLLNSKLLDWYLHKVSMRAYQTAYLYVKKYIEQLPIRRIDFDNLKDVDMHDEMVRLVERMLELHRRKAALRDTPTEELRELEREIERIDGEIDALVYRLYGLTEEEVAVVEGRNH